MIYYIINFTCVSRPLVGFLCRWSGFSDRLSATDDVIVFITILRQNFTIKFWCPSSPAGCRWSAQIDRWSGWVAAYPPDEWYADCRLGDNLPGKAAYNGGCCRGHGVESATVLGVIAWQKKPLTIRLSKLLRL